MTREFLQGKGLNFNLESNLKNKIKIFNNFPETSSIDFNKNELIIFIDEDCLTGINVHLSSDKNNELGGVLTGFNCELVSGEKFVYIKHFIKADHINSSLSRLTFTPETWQQINDELENKYPDEIIIGWYHSHPGHSVFLSEYDLFIQKNFFNLYFNVAYVFDPVLNQTGFFVWKDNDIIKTDNYRIIKNPEKIEPSEEIKNENMNDNIKNKSGKNIFLILILIINLGVSAFLLFQITTMKDDIKLLTADLIEYENLKRDYNALNQKLEDHIIENELSGNYFEYEIKEGDNLKGIAFGFLNDSNRYEEIMKLNNLKNESDISGLTKLKIPVGK